MAGWARSISESKHIVDSADLVESRLIERFPYIDRGEEQRALGLDVSLVDVSTLRSSV